MRAFFLPRLGGLCAMMAAALGTTGCGAAAHSKAAQDRPLEAFRIALLELAFDAASAIPPAPHLKDRCKMQELVAATCLALDQPVRAGRYVEHITDWRRGAAHAELAYYLATRGDVRGAARHAVQAEALAERENDWRRAQIRTRIAQTYVALRQPALARSFESDDEPSEIGRATQTRAEFDSASHFEDHVKETEALVARGDLDALRNAMEAYGALYERHFGDAARRERIEPLLRDVLDQLPVIVRLDGLEQAARVAASQGAGEVARRWIAECDAVADAAAQWPLEYRLPVLGRIARLRALAGEPTRARAMLDTALAQYRAGSRTVADLWRAGALRPLAEAYAQLGDPAVALGVYRMAVDEGALNPNARPRAEDLTATCLSMARSGVEPDETLWARLRAIRQGLTDPW